MACNVWMIIASYYPHIGGAEQQAQRLSERLASSDMNVSIVTRRHNSTFPFIPPIHENINGIPIHRVYSRGPSKIASLMFVINGLRCLWKSKGNHIYHAHDLGAPALLGLFAKKILGGCLVLKFRSGEEQLNLRLNNVFGKTQWLFLRNDVDRFVVVSKEGMDLLHKLRVPAEKITYIQNGVDTERFRPVPSVEKAAARKRLDLPVDKNVVLFVGRLVHVKGVDVLLGAWRQLPDELRSCSLLLVVGDGPEAFDLKRLADKYGIAATTRFAGRQDDVLDYYHASDLFVLPSRSEGLPNALLEAMSCGLPVVCSSVGGIPDMVNPVDPDLLVPPGDEQKLA